MLTTALALPAVTSIMFLHDVFDLVVSFVSLKQLRPQCCSACGGDCRAAIVTLASAEVCVIAHLTIQDLFDPFEQLPAEACLGPPELPANQGMLVSFVGPNGNPICFLDASVFELRVRICVVRKCSMENVELLVGSTMLNDHDTLEQSNGSELGGNMTMP